VVRRGAEDGVDGLLLVEHLAEVDVIGALVRPSVFGVALGDLALDGEPAGLALVVEAAVVGLLAGVGDGDDAGVLVAEQGAGVGTPLAAAPDDRDVDRVARRDEPRAAEDVSRQDGDGGGRRCGLAELPPGDLQIAGHGLSLSLGRGRDLPSHRTVSKPHAGGFVKPPRRAASVRAP